jgi:hypothetical protein
MSWKTLIQPGPVWTGVSAYADARIAELTAVCVNPRSADAEIRAAQAGIEELQRLQGLPDSLRATAELSKAPRRREY